MSSYTPWISLQIQHGYYADNLASPLQIAPTSACVQWMAQYGLLFRAGKAGGQLYYADADLLLSFDTLQPLDFQVTCTAPEFLNLSDFDAMTLGDLTLGSSIFYFDNRQNNKPQLSPSLNDSVLKVRPPQFAIQLQAGQAVTYSIRDSLVQASVWSGVADANHVLYIDLREQPDGRYQLYAGDHLQENFYLCRIPASQCWGVIAIYPGGSEQLPYLQQGCPAIVNADLLNLAYVLTLQARTCFWRYRIFSQSQDTHHYDDYQVTGKQKNGSGQIAFSMTKPDGDGAPWIFESALPIAMAQRPGDWEFFLSRKHASSRHKIRLPYAQGKLLILPDASVPARKYADIYVYL
ncbi:MAG: hypothetical protein KGM99_02935 [Burkholderiales bacterium]|nr:hypothetical protein [Burkholderiales bacterium]